LPESVDSAYMELTMQCVLALAIPYTAITIIFIILATGVGAFVRKRSRDKCLRDFEQNMVTLEETSGKRVWGRLRVENTGLELVYPAKRADEDGHEEASFILYKYEFVNIQALVRFHDDLSDLNKARRERQLKKVYHPGAAQRVRRRVRNVFRTVRDSVWEVINILISQAKKASVAGKVLSGQDKYVSQMRQELMGSVGMSYEPLLERYIGRKVVLEMLRGEKVVEYSGVLKEYTAEFVEVMDVDYRMEHDEPRRKADLVVARQWGVVRHLGE
jgi:hypothetical protein